MKIANLEKLRIHSGKTLEEVASVLGVSKSTIHNWEKEPEKVSLTKLTEYVVALNYSLEDLFEKDTSIKKTILDVKVNQELIELRENLKKNIQTFSDYYTDHASELVLSNGSIIASILQDMKKMQVDIRKPRLAIVGESDAGKSTLINYILEQGDVLPARWTPATGAIIKVAHIDDKPAWLNGNTVVLKSDINERVDETWDLLDSKYDDKDYFNSHVVEQGSRDVISSFGDRDGDNYENSLDDVYTIYTYLDAEILKVIEIWDTPGIGAGDDSEGESDETLSIYAQTNADMLIYLSVANQFIHSSDAAYLRQSVKRIDRNSDFKENLPAWHNLMIVASQAHIIDGKVERENILTKGSERLLNQFGTGFLDEEHGYDEKAFRKRFFTFSRENESIRKDLEKELNDIFENKSRLILLESIDSQKEFYTQSLALLTNVIDEKKDFLNKRNNTYEELKDAIDNLESVLEANELIEKKLQEASAKGRNDSELEFLKFYNQNMTEKKLLSWLESEEVKNKKDSKKEFTTWLSGKFQDQLESILKKNGEKFQKEFEKAGEEVQRTSQINVDSFDFASVMAGLVTSGIVGGAFAIVAAGISSNLGLYILVAQVGGLLTSIGVISSPAVLTSLVSATFGPVGWAIGLSILSGTIVSWIFRSSAWKGKFVKQIMKAYTENEALDKFIEASDIYWNKTDESIRKLKESMNLVANENVRLLQEKYDSSPEDIELAIKQLLDASQIVAESKVVK